MFLSLLVLIIGIPYHSDFINFNFEENDTSEDSLKVMSYNVRLFDLYNWTSGKNTRDKIFDLLREEDADVICFQEFYRSDRNGAFNTKDTLLELLPKRFYHEKSSYKAKGKQHFGIATLSRYPIVSEGEIEISSVLHNYCIYSDIKKGEDTIRVYNVHLASIRFQKEDYQFIEQAEQNENKLDGSKRIIGRLSSAFISRAKQTDLIVKSIIKSPYPVILCGDFNDTPISYCYNEFSNHLHDSFIERGNGIGSTYIGVFPSFRIDYIMHSSSFQTNEFRVLSEKLSDHRALVGEYTLLKD